MKKYILILLGISFLLVALIVVSVIPKKNNSLSQAIITPISFPVLIPSKTQTQHTLDLKPGLTTKQQVLTILGEPQLTESNNNLTILSYPVPSTTRQNKIYIKDNIIQYVNESITKDNSLLRDHIATTKESESGVLYDPQQIDVGFTWHIFAKSGIAFLSSANGYTIQVLHFPPTNYQDFLQTTAKTFSLSTNTNDNQEKFQ